MGRGRHVEEQQQMEEEADNDAGKPENVQEGDLEWYK